MRFLILILAMLSVVTPANAQLQAHTFITMYDNGGDEKETAIQFLGAMYHGIEISNQVLKAQGRQMLYCMPSSMKNTNTVESAFPIFRIEFFKNVERYGRSHPAYPLMKGLINSFPCP